MKTYTQLLESQMRFEKIMHVDGKKYEIKLGEIITKDAKGRDFTVTVNSITDIPKQVRDKVTADLTGRAWINGQYIMYKDVAEESARQQAEMKKWKKDVGVDHLRKCFADEDRYHRQFDRMMSDEQNDGVKSPKAPANDIEKECEKYPIAAAYLKAERFESASNYMKSAAGRKAKNKIMQGVDPEQAIADMHKEWGDHTANID
jgi:hypothetical protein